MRGHGQSPRDFIKAGESKGQTTNADHRSVARPRQTDKDIRFVLSQTACDAILFSLFSVLTAYFRMATNICTQLLNK